MSAATVLGDYLTPQPKSKIKARNGLDVGQYRFFTSSPIQSKFLNEYQYDDEALIFGTGGKASVHFCDEPFSSSTDCLVMYGKGNANIKLIYYYLMSNMHLLQNGFKGAGLKHISKGYILNIPIRMPSRNEQDEIVATLDLISKSEAILKGQLVRLDDIVKSRFLELFGTIAENPHGFPMATLKEVCSKITDGKHGGCEQEFNSGYYYVGAREIYDGSIHYDTAPQITYADFAKDYRRCNIQCGDMVIVTTGATIGKTAIATSPLTEHTLLQKSVALLKIKTDMITAEFLRYCYIVNPSMYRVENASAQPNLLLSKMNATCIYLPPMELQEQFTSFVKQADKSKSAAAKCLQKAEYLKSALMQQYFG